MSRAARRTRVAALALALGGAVGCGPGGASGPVSCTVSNPADGGAATVAFCVEYTGVPAQQIQSECMFSGLGPDAGPSATAAFANGPCPRGQLLGGCRVTAGDEIATVWYYEDVGLTPAQLERGCGGMNAVFVSP